MTSVHFQCTLLKKYSDLTVAEFLRRQGIRLILPCGGNGTCGQCQVTLRHESCGNEQVKACCTKVCDIIKDDAVTIEIPDSKLIRQQAAEISHGKIPWLAAVDLGSTTIEMAALSEDGEVLGEARDKNPQVSYGSDILSRIRAASESSFAAGDMQRLAESTIQSLIRRLSVQYGLKPHPEKMAIAANTTMGHLLTGEPVEALGHAPFEAGDISLRNISKVFFSDKTPVYMFPGISAFVGGDIVSGMYFLNLDKKENPSLLIDLGTNGEMALGDRNGFLVTSTAAGPAFEAANISCGCAGLPGAIRAVTFKGIRPLLTLIPWDEDLTKLSPGERMQREMQLKAKRPGGICGSGLISAVAGMKKTGIIDGNGTFTKDEWIEKGFVLWKGRGEEDIRLTQDDIRELLMAKSAIESGIEILIGRSGQKPSEVFLAGGLGSAVSVDDARTIGLFPETLSGARITAAGNTSLKGAGHFFKDEMTEAAQRFARIKALSEDIRLAGVHSFDKLYISNLKI